MNTLSNLSKNFFDILDMNTSKNSESDKVCFQNAIETFLKTGRKEDAFVVYFCFSEIFNLFGNGYDNTKKLLETLSDHEYHSGELLSKHRDHYSHSVYVFTLGLAIYACDKAYKKAFLNFYGIEDNGESAFKFLRLWGIVSLFHDIGYPLQLAHEQIKTYSQEIWGKSQNNLYVSYGNLENFLTITEEINDKLKISLGTNKNFSSINDLLAYGLQIREGYDAKEISDKLYTRIIKQPNFMDHGYFSSVILAKHFLSVPDFKMNMENLDILTAILLHNNFNKYDIPNAHPINITEHPLAYLLIVCDELQAWDRLAYGKVSKRDPIAWKVKLSISDNKISICYYFDSCTITDAEGKKRLNKSFGEIQDGDFVNNIFKFVVSSLNIETQAEEQKKVKRHNIYASDDNFINLCDFAKAIHASYSEHCKEFSGERIDEDFSKLPLEFKVSNIRQAQSYAEKLELINCFYSSKDLDYPVVENLQSSQYGVQGSDNFGFLCREEHVRWVKEKLALGWRYGVEGVDYHNIEERNAKKVHKCIVPYEYLSEEDKTKDAQMLDNIIPLLKKFDSNIKIYSYRFGRKPDLVIAGVGHRYYNPNETAVIKEKVKEALLKYSERYRVVVRTGYAYGADQLIAECANELCLTTKAVLPMEYEEFISYVRKDAELNGVNYTDNDEIKLRNLLAQTVNCKVFVDPRDKFNAFAQYNISKCDKLIAIWDGEVTPLFDANDQPINRGGTYHCIQMAKERLNDGDIHIIRCHRK